MTLPGRDFASAEVWGRFDALVRRAPEETLFVVDRTVARLHPTLKRALARRDAVFVRAGEPLKQMRALEALAVRAAALPRGGTLVAVGGGSLGDAVTVLAHLHKRGVALIHVPTTLLAAVDSSVGGKGAVNLGKLKNALGCFHFARETWLCPEWFATVSEAQRREGRLEAWKMAATLDAAIFRRWARKAPSDDALVRTARQLKLAVCQADPFETKGLREVLNFGHTLGHVVESATGFRVRHGDAVGLGMLCALDVGCALDVTPLALRDAVEAALPQAPRARARLKKALVSVTPARLSALLKGDKKRARDGSARMVLLAGEGEWVLKEVPLATLTALLTAWRRGVRP